MFNLGSLDVMRLVEIGAALVVSLVVVFFVLGPLIGGLLRGGANAAGAVGAPALAGPAGSAPALTGPDGEPVPIPDSGIDVARIQGAVTASSSKRVAEVVEQHPDESVQIIRGWLNNAI